MTDKEQIIIDGVDVSECKHLYSRWTGSLPKDTCAEYDYIDNPEDDGLINLCKTHPNCYYKQLQKEKFENLNNRQMVESAENLIYENSELYKNLKEKEQECDTLKSQLDFAVQQKECFEQECEELKEELKREIKNTVDMERLAKSYGQDMLTYMQKKQIEIGEFQTNMDCYRKALEEIEEIVNEPCVDAQEDCKHCDNWCEHKDILEIINKAKGGNNENT